MSAEEWEIRPGAGVDAADGRLGTADEVRVRPETGELAGLVVRRGWTDQLLYVDGEQIERIDGDGTVRLHVTRATAERAAADGQDRAAGAALAAGADGRQLRVPVLAERLHAAVQPVDLGELRVTKRVETAEETVHQAVARDELEVERVPVNRPLEAPAVQRTEGEWLVIPVMEEVLIVRKQLMLTEEVRIRTRRVVAEQEVRETVRRERVELEDATRHGVRGLGAAGIDTAPARPLESAAGAADRPRKETPQAKRRTNRGQGQQRDRKPPTS